MIEPIKYTDGASVIAAASALRKKMLSAKSPHKDTFLERTRKKETKLKSGEENFDKITSRRGFTAAAYQRGLAIAKARDGAKNEALNDLDKKGALMKKQKSHDVIYETPKRNSAFILVSKAQRSQPSHARDGNFKNAPRGS